ncbi:uncharacterized protein LOC107264909 isoform X2 [Cephus cinctus]|uniref:Uncharacterized protein LOC107264909 isoform X2 n=1 Tax=Cephus cinctus TaxID=211228 RepID=A0AAJ7FFF7_CEPCN|nr:uncharacterized protein LOC107264909 isoform X2 [Cephus cinctus]
MEKKSRTESAEENSTLPLCKDLLDEKRWKTVTNDSFVPPKFVNERMIGRRRELVKKFFDLHVSQQIYKELTADPPIEPLLPTEYVDKYCDSEFIPILDRFQYNTEKYLKYPLYGGAINTYYKQQLDKGYLKARAEIYNFNEPFRKTSFFTTPPDLANREPRGGF